VSRRICLPDAAGSILPVKYYIPLISEDIFSELVERANLICHYKAQKLNLIFLLSPRFCFGNWHQRADERLGNLPPQVTRSLSGKLQGWKTLR